MPTDSALVHAVRLGDYRTTRRLVLGSTPPEREADAARVRTLYRAVGGAAGGEVSPDGTWVGGVSEGHDECVTLAHMACIGPDRSARLAAVPRRVAADLPALFPDHVEHVVAVWSELYQRSPKSWDRIAHYPVMFTWVRGGLAAPPTADGAVNLWLSELASSRRYPPGEYTSLYAVTLPRLFTAEVRPSLGAAAIDSQLPPGDRRRIDELVLRLVGDGIWSAADVSGWIESGLAVRESPFQRRWLVALGDRLGRHS